LNFTKLSIAAVLAVTATSAFAANDLASAFKEGKVDGRIRAHYFYTDWDKNSDWDKGSGIYSSKPDVDSKGMAVGGSLVFNTAPVYGVSAGLGAYTTQSVGQLTQVKNGAVSGEAKNTTASDLFARATNGQGAQTEYGKGYAVIAQAYMQYEVSKSSVKAGRMLMTNPFINPNDTKMIPLAIQGASAVVKEIDKTVIVFDFANKIKERGMSYFGGMADTGDTPDAIKNYYNTHYTATSNSTVTGSFKDINGATVSASYINTFGQHDAPSVYVIGAKNTSVKDVELQAWVMKWPDIVTQGLIEANYNTKLGAFGLNLGARYIKQYDNGAGDIIRPGTGDSVYGALGATGLSPTGSKATEVQKKGDSDNSVDTYMYAVRAVVAYEAAKLLVSYSHTDKGGDLIAPWRGFPTDGYTRAMTQTDWNANTKAYRTQLDYDFSGFVKGVSALLGYAYYDRDISKVPYQGNTDRYYGNGDTRQINFDVKYAVPSIKGLEWKARTMIQKNDITPAKVAGNSANGTASEGIANNTSNRELRIEMNYLF
jgi:outer membrane porin, OprD family